MTKPYLIAVDLDGTLLNEEKKIQEKTRQTLLEAQRRGHIVAIATGRPYRATEAYYQSLSLDTPVVNFNGALVHHPHDRDWGVFHQPLELETAKTIIKTCEAFQVKNIIVEVTDDIYLRYHDSLIVDAFGVGGPKFQTGDLKELLNDDPTSLVIYPHDDQVDDLHDLIENTHAEVIEQRVWGAPWRLIEIVRKGLNKAVGLEKIAEFYDIPQERIIAFGDETNDLEMIRYAGHGVAMANAIDELKNIADTVTKSNNEDGIAEYLRKIL